MPKFIGDTITNSKTNITKEIIVRANSPVNWKEALVGGGLILLGIGYLTIQSFKNGCQAFLDAELKTFDELDLLS